MVSSVKMPTNELVDDTLYYQKYQKSNLTEVNIDDFNNITTIEDLKNISGLQKSFLLSY